MQTFFEPEQLKNQDVARSNEIFRSCVHCGLCTGTCPTYQLLNDELDSPRGRIYLLKDMLENDRKPTADVVQHLDRCLGCLACMTTCPAGVHYGHLIDYGRKLIEEQYDRPFFEQLYRNFLAFVLPKPGLFRLLLMFVPLGRWLSSMLPKSLRVALDLAPKLPFSVSAVGKPGHYKAAKPKGRVAIFLGCVQQVLAPEINEATINLLNRLNYDVEVLTADCCGGITHHMGKTDSSYTLASSLIRSVQESESKGGAFDAFIMSASGCGFTVKDYGYIFQDDPIMAVAAARVSSLAKDISEFITPEEINALVHTKGERITYHSACSLQHGQKISAQPLALLRAAGFEVKQPTESHLCCGSAGTYNLLQPDISAQLKDRKLNAIARTQPQIVATGNVGCLKQLEKGLADSGVPIVHTVQLLDWATGGVKPAAVSEMKNIHDQE